MKKAELEVGHYYQAKVDGQLATVKLTGIVSGYPRGKQAGTTYRVTNVLTNLSTNFYSAQKFCEEVPPPKPNTRKLPTTHPKFNVVGTKTGRTPKPKAKRPLEAPGIVAPKQDKLAASLRKAKDLGTCKAPHLMIVARAGTGKSTTMLLGAVALAGGDPTFIPEEMNGKPGGLHITPSTQQQAIWDAMLRSKGRVQSIHLAAFGTVIAKHLKTCLRALDLPRWVTASTMHGMGYSAILRAFPELNRSVNGFRVNNIVAELLGYTDRFECNRKAPEVLQNVSKLVSLCKQNLLTYWIEENRAQEIMELVNHHDIDLNGAEDQVFDLVPQVLQRCQDVEKDNCIDFDDMIWLPLALDLPVPKYDLLLVDEAQDLNRMQQELALRAGRRIIFCGDPMQAIFGFAGADAKSMSRMAENLSNTERGCNDLRLTVTRRCGKALVTNAQKLVPDFEAHESNPDGAIRTLLLKDYRKEVHSGDMILCRCNAPLLPQCFAFLADGVKANIQGRDIGQGLVRLLEKMDKHHTGNLPEALANLSQWILLETQKENAKKNPSEARILSIDGRYDALCYLAEDMETVKQVADRINAIYTNDKNNAGIMLSTCHKAKGLEADRVFILLPREAQMPHPMARSAWEQDQEQHLMYVAWTRGKTLLTYVV